LTHTPTAPSKDDSAVTIHGYQNRYRKKIPKAVDPHDTEELF